MTNPIDVVTNEVEQNAVREWMTANGFTNSTLAEKMDFSYNYIFKISTGHSVASDAFKWRFAEVFGYDEAHTLFDNGQEKEPEAVAA